MVSKTELIGRARELAPTVAQQASVIDRQNAVPAALIAEFCDAGFMKIFVPKRYGGFELDYSAMAGIVNTIAQSDCSTAWVLAFFVGHNFLHALFPEKSQEEAFGGRSFALTPGNAAPTYTLTPTDGGYLATGQSSWNSGSSAAEWYLCGGLIKTEGAPPEHRLFLIPASEVTPIANWDVIAMCGTASNDIEAKGVFVPAHRTALASTILEGRGPGALLHPNPMYSMPVLPFIQGEVLPIVVGAYRAMADEFRRMTEGRISAHSGLAVGTKQTSQIKIAKGLGGASLAEVMLADYTAMLTSGNYDWLRPIAVRSEMKVRCALMVDYCANGINELMKAAGANAFRLASPLQRFFRDINMLRVHGYLDLDSACETYGRILQGLPPQAPL
jgi:3-hydroxy-9,10-secoandrosta-1,3,5(10)-triene-9,17-dione monooxygenase